MPSKNTNSDTQPLTRTQRRRQQTRSALVNAVRKLTAEKGVDAVTISEIAEEADIGKGSFYNYFESKDELLKEAVESIIFQSGEIIDTINAAVSEPVDMIATAFATFDQLMRGDPLLGWFMVRMNAHDPAVGASMAERFVRDVNLGIESGDFDVPDRMIAIRAVQAALVNFFRHRLLGDIDDAGVVHFIHLMLRTLGVDEDTAKLAAKTATSTKFQPATEK
jgi:AcrR family transcriptional regulator